MSLFVKPADVFTGKGEDPQTYNRGSSRFARCAVPLDLIWKFGLGFKFFIASRVSPDIFEMLVFFNGLHFIDARGPKSIVVVV